MPKRIEMDIDPVPTAVFELMERLKGSRSTEVQQLAVVYIALARKFNWLIAKLEYGDIVISDVPEEMTDDK